MLQDNTEIPNLKMQKVTIGVYVTNIQIFGNYSNNLYKYYCCSKIFTILKNPVLP